MSDERQIAELRAQHVEQDNGCKWDGFVWPCNTAVALDALSESEARVSALTAAAQAAVDRCGNEDCAACGPLRNVLAADRQPADDDGEG